MPPVSSRTVSVSSGVGSAPDASRTNSASSPSASPPSRIADDALRAVDVDERLRELGGDVRLGVAKRRDDQHPRRGARADEVSDEEQRRRVGPVQVLEHEQDGRLGRDADEELGHRRVEA